MKMLRSAFVILISFLAEDLQFDVLDGCEVLGSSVKSFMFYIYCSPACHSALSGEYYGSF